MTAKDLRRGPVKTYKVAFECDEPGWWVASVRGLRGCHTQGRTVDAARRRIVEAMELFVDDARTAKIVDDVKLPRVLRGGRLKMSARDAARLLGLSHQRVHQLT